MSLKVIKYSHHTKITSTLFEKKKFLAISKTKKTKFLIICNRPS